MFDHISKHLKIYQKYSATTLTLKKKKILAFWNVVFEMWWNTIFHVWYITPEEGRTRRGNNIGRKQITKFETKEMQNEDSAT